MSEYAIHAIIIIGRSAIIKGLESGPAKLKHSPAKIIATIEQI
jgi:hypothetical protein